MLNLNKHRKKLNLNIHQQSSLTTAHVCVYHCAQLSYTTRHRTVLIIFPLILQTIIIAQMLSTGGERITKQEADKRTGTLFCWWTSWNAGNKCCVLGLGFSFDAVHQLVPNVVEILYILDRHARNNTFTTDNCY